MPDYLVTFLERGTRHSKGTLLVEAERASDVEKLLKPVAEAKNQDFDICRNEENPSGRAYKSVGVGD